MKDHVTVFVGCIIHATQENPLVILEDAALGVCGNKIVFLEEAPCVDSLVAPYKSHEVHELQKGQFLMPGMIDTHVHAPQYPNSGIGLDLPLLQWLEKYTFPTEAMFKNTTFAEKAYKLAVNRLMRNGTTTAFYNATLHIDSCLVLYDICDAQSQRAFVGKVCMDQESPDYLIEDTNESLTDTISFIQKAKARKSDIVQPAIVPRFAIACSKQLMTSLAEVAKQHDVHIQSHLCECRPEVALVKKFYPESPNYTEVYGNCGILDCKSSMAHCVYCGDEEIELLKSKGTGVSHCPNSNTSLKSGLCDVRKMLDMGVKVGLGTDVSGGYHPSILDAMRQACQVSNIISMDRAEGSYKCIDYREAFRLATLGGSQVLGLEEVVGNFAVGKQFDALRINTKAPDSPCDIFEKDSTQDIIEKFIYLGDDRNITEVYVAGKLALSNKK